MTRVWRYALLGTALVASLGSADLFLAYSPLAGGMERTLLVGSAAVFPVLAAWYVALKPNRGDTGVGLILRGYGEWITWIGFWVLVLAIVHRADLRLAINVRMPSSPLIVTLAMAAIITAYRWESVKSKRDKLWVVLTAIMAFLSF